MNLITLIIALVLPPMPSRQSIIPPRQQYQIRFDWPAVPGAIGYVVKWGTNSGQYFAFSNTPVNSLEWTAPSRNVCAQALALRPDNSCIVMTAEDKAGGWPYNAMIITGSGTLQFSPSITAPVWQDAATGRSMYIVPLGPGNAFYRIAGSPARITGEPYRTWNPAKQHFGG